jgi:hypothetical protein
MLTAFEMSNGFYKRFDLDTLSTVNCQLSTVNCQLLYFPPSLCDNMDKTCAITEFLNQKARLQKFILAKTWFLQ